MKPYVPTIEKKLYNWKRKIKVAIEDCKSNRKDQILNKGNKQNNKDKLSSLLESTLLENEETKKFILKWVEKEYGFRYLSTKTSFDILLGATEKNDGDFAKGLVLGVKKQAALHPELPTFKTLDGKSILHIAAKKDKDKVLLQLAKVNPLWLKQQDKEGNTPLHIASKEVSLKCLVSIAKKYPTLLSIRNKKGQKPEDLQAGELLKGLVSDKEIEAARKEEKEKYLQALNKLKFAHQKNLGNI